MPVTRSNRVSAACRASIFPQPKVIAESRFFASRTDYSALDHSTATHPASSLKSVEEVARAKLLSVTQNARLCAEHVQLMDTSPGYCSYFLAYLDRHQRLLDAKPALIQEHFADDVWRMLVAVTLLNKTTGKKALPVFWMLMDKWPTAEAMADANLDELIDSIATLGLQNTRAKRLHAMSGDYVRNPPDCLRPIVYHACKSKYFPGDDWDRVAHKELPAFLFWEQRGSKLITPISHLSGSGQYATDSYRIFCVGGEEWRYVRPKDKELVRYLVRRTYRSKEIARADPGNEQRWRWALEGMQWSSELGADGQANEAYIEALIDDLVSNDPAL
ncbi:hypothetical protein EW146_g8588 [Bondarzewia mesenterica]|uniref:HhH-GPD domain-containing protein n=1 Tax=Bondarzewia mesenterica TaxID=1095465 RepID=A0A4S4LDH4_9AGAM|nr:hypothetical protein EW146_g8588 [Bondarzewia mesenterica]